MFNDVLVVCVGNICRSPMAEAILRHRLAADSSQVHSAGLHALHSAPIDALAAQVLHSHGLALDGHRSRQVDRQMLRRAGLILTMERRHLASLLHLAPEVRGKTFLIGQWQQAQIADPYKRPKAVFEQTYRQLWRCVDDWLPYLQSGDTQ